MHILVTGSSGFIGKHLVAGVSNHQLNQQPESIMELNSTHFEGLLDDYSKTCDFVFHLASVSRPSQPEEYDTINVGVTNRLLHALRKHNNPCPIVLSSSIQAILDNPYGESKRKQEQLLIQHHRETGAKVLIYRLPNVFGKWGKPHYTSVIATFCYQISRGLPIHVHNPHVELQLAYIDEVITEFIRAMHDHEEYETHPYGEVPVIYRVRLDRIVQLLYAFKRSREIHAIPDLPDAFAEKLYYTYLSYAPHQTEHDE